MKLILAVLMTCGVIEAAEPSPVEELLKKEIIGPRTALIETQEFADAKIPRLTVPNTAKEWMREAQNIRERVLKQVVFRGEAAKWRDAKSQVETIETIKGGDGYIIKKLRYEILPDFWIPALLYEPEKIEGKVTVSLAVNGHDRNGKAADYKQVRCINMVKRGMIVLNVEWLGMGQLNVPGNAHGAMNQLDLCGSSGLAPFYLSMSRGLDILLNHPNADPKRVAVSGLSGGGWQTIFISSLDTRVTLTNPVAGYSSFRTRIQHFKDLGDSEQTPCDLGTVTDYLHLTAMMAPRPTLLTFNGKDNCCFEAGYALPPLYDGSLPIFKLYGAEKSLRSHVNDDPGTHNFFKENREALYKMIGDHFYPNDKNYKWEEFACDKEVKSKDDLNVPLPPVNLTFNSLALKLAKDLPRKGDKTVAALDKITAFVDFGADVEKKIAVKEEKNGLSIGIGKLVLGKRWSVPVVQLEKEEPKGTTIVINDAGRAASAAKIEELLNAGQRVVAVDLWYFGEAKPNEKDWLWGLILNTLGQRPLGLQAGELAAVARLIGPMKKPVTVMAIGPRSSTIALVAAALEPKAIDSLELHQPLGSFQEIIEANRVVANMPEMFCFGLFEQFDVKDIASLVSPRPIKLVK